jgi:hypothetical protein
MCQFFFFFVHSSFRILYHNQNQHAHKYPSCAIFFPWVFLSFYIFLSCTRAISLSTHTWVFLCQDYIPHYHCFLYQQISFTQFSFVEKKNFQRGFMPIIGPIPTIVAAFGQSYRCPNSGHCSRCWPNSLQSKFRS